MTQTEPAHTRSAIITELACISAELADMQVRNAELSTRVSRIIRDLSCTTATIPPGADLQQLRQRLGTVRGRLEATADEIRTSAERMPPAAQAASGTEEEGSTYSRETEEIAALCRECLAYDPVTGVLTWIKPRSPRVRFGDVAGASCVTRGGKLYVYVKIDGKNFCAHRVAWLLYYGKWPTHEVRHGNLKGDDNRIMNLIEGDRFDVTQDNSRRHDNTSGAIGVRLDEASSENKPWRASITRDGQVHSLGIFATKEEAIAARQKAEREYRAARDASDAAEASAASADPAPAADAPRVPRREPEVRDAGGGLVQDGGSLKPAGATVEKAPLVRDVILDAYATTTKTIAEIAEHSGSTRDSVKVTLNKARHKDEPRIKAGDDLRAPKTEPTLAPVAQPTARDVADAAKPVAEIPAPRPIPTGGIEIPAGKLIAIRGAEVHGPAGIWRTSKETAKAFSMLADGQLYGLETMARHGGLLPAVCVGLIPMWTAALAKIGIELHHHKGYGLRLRAIGGQA